VLSHLSTFIKLKIGCYVAPTVLLAVTTFICVTHPTSAQEVRATLGGRVTDSQGAVIPDAQVVVVSDNTSVQQQTRTNREGNWQVRFLLPGTYHFRVESTGFQSQERTGFILQAGDNKQIDILLQVGSQSQTVEVKAETPLIDTTAAVSGTVINQDELNDLPSQSHVASLFATLSPGIVAQDQGSNVVRLWSNGGASSFTANGGRNNIFSNNYLLDSMPNTKQGGYISFSPPMDSVQEVRILTNAYDASIGRQAGSTITMSTKSGGKQYHGELYEYNQNNILNANLFQTNLASGSLPPVHFDEFGGTVGGPVWIPKVYNGANKTFFFAAFDKTLNTNPLPSTISVPTVLERQGDFSQSFTTQVVNGTSVRYPVQVYDPASVDTNGNRVLFPGMKIPVDRLSPIARNILGYVPLPNTAGNNTSNASNNFVSNAKRIDTFPALTVRVDQNWNNSHRSFVTVNWSHLGENMNDNFNNAATGTDQFRTAKRLGLNHVWVLSPSSVLQVFYSLNRFEQSVRDHGAGFDPTQLGFPESFASQLALPSFPQINGVAGTFGTGQAGNYNNNTYHTWSGSVTQTYRNHTFRYGPEFWLQQEANANLATQGAFTFDNHWTRQNAILAGGPGDGATMGSFLLGLPSSGNVPRNADNFYSQYFTALYFQDDWRFTSKLTVNIGFRWDYQRPVTERYNRLTDRYDPNVVSPVSPSAQASYAHILANNPTNPAVQLLGSLVPANAFQVRGAQLFAGANGVSRSPINPAYHEWQPRIGVAYQLGKNTVIRGGFGKFVQADFVTGGQNGFSRTTDFVASQDSFFTPYDTLANPFRGGILSPTGSSLGPLTNLGQGVNWDDPNLNRMYSWEYSVHLQHQLKDWLLEVGYTHNETKGISTAWDQNLPSFGLWQQLQAPQFDANGRPQDQLRWNQLVPNPFYQLPGITGSLVNTKNIALKQLLNPVSLLGTINQNKPSGSNQYDALLFKAEHRFGHGFTMIDSFTWSKLFEDSSFLGPQVAGSVVEHKLGGEDRPFHLSLTGVWNLPFGKGRKWGSMMPKALDMVAGGWKLSGTYTAQSGTPVVFSTDSFFTGNDFSLPNDKRTLNRWFDTSQFLPFPSKNTDISNYPAWTGIQDLPGDNYVPVPGDTIKNGVYQDFANYIRRYPTRWGDVRVPGVNSADLGIYKTFSFTERLRLQIRLTAFNAFNHPRFGAPNTDPANANFGLITAAQVNQARTLEMAGKFYF